MFHMAPTSWVLDTLAVLIVFWVRCEMNEALANMTLSFSLFFFYFFLSVSYDVRQLAAT